jgi:predicted glycosyltransferase
MIVVTHLLGAGHLSRALVLARAFAAEGHDTHVVSGGVPVPLLSTTGITLHQLLPLRSDGANFSKLFRVDGTQADETDFQDRRVTLQRLARDIEPDILITELFPFGRRILKDEFETLLETVCQHEAKPRIFASVRDILAPPSKPAKVAFAEHIVEEYYDAVLVHSDPDVVALDISWPVSAKLAGVLRYTGFVAPAAPETPARDGAGEIIVSAGGGAVGEPVFEAAIEAAKVTEWTWRLLIGGQDADARVERLRQGAPSNAMIEPARGDFRSMLTHAKASVSLCGYNTAMDLLQTGCPAVVVPFDAGSEVEQGLRAQALSHLPGFEAISVRDLDGPGLVSTVNRVLSSPRREPSAFRFDGATETVRICIGALR